MSPRTAKDDQPGPTGRRHISTGGEADQSVLMRTPGTMSSRFGPRKPGHSGPFRVRAGITGVSSAAATVSVFDGGRINPDGVAGWIGFAGAASFGAAGSGVVDSARVWSA